LRKHEIIEIFYLYHGLLEEYPLFVYSGYIFFCSYIRLMIIQDFQY
jgi:hypothetical protein